MSRGRVIQTEFGITTAIKCGLFSLFSVVLILIIAYADGNPIVFYDKMELMNFSFVVDSRKDETMTTLVLITLEFMLLWFLGFFQNRGKGIPYFMVMPIAISVLMLLFATGSFYHGGKENLSTIGFITVCALSIGSLYYKYEFIAPKAARLKWE